MSAGFIMSLASVPNTNRLYWYMTRPSLVGLAPSMTGIRFRSDCTSQSDPRVGPHADLDDSADLSGQKRRPPASDGKRSMTAATPSNDAMHTELAQPASSSAPPEPHPQTKGHPQPSSVRPRPILWTRRRPPPKLAKKPTQDPPPGRPTRAQNPRTPAKYRQSIAKALTGMVGSEKIPASASVPKDPPKGPSEGSDSCTP